MTSEMGGLNKSADSLQKQTELSLRMDPRTGAFWYLDDTRRVVVLDEVWDIERDRQQLDPKSDPAPGFQKFSSRLTMREMPVAAGEIAPPEKDPNPQVPPQTKTQTQRQNAPRQRNSPVSLSPDSRAWTTLPVETNRATPTAPVAAGDASATMNTMLEDSLKYQKEALKTAAKPETKPTTQDVFRDQRSQDRFGKFLENESTEGEEIAHILAFPKDAKAGDLARVEAMRAKFGERMNSADEIKNEFNINTIEDFTAGFPELERVTKALGPQGAVDMIHKWLPEIAASDPARFATIRAYHQSIKNLRENSQAKVRFEDICSKNGLRIDSKEFARVMENPNKGERKTELRRMVREQMSGWNKMIDGISRYVLFGFGSSSRNTAKDLESVKQDIETGKKQLTDFKAHLGQSIGMTFDQNDELREALFLEMQNLRSQPKETMTLKEGRTRITSEAEAIKAWEEHKKTPEYTGLTDDTAKQADFDKWSGQHLSRAEGNDKGGGIWGKIFKAFFEAMFGDKTKFKL